MSEEVALLQDQIDVVEAQAKSLRETLRSLDADVEKWASKRDSLNNQGKQLRESIRHFKAQRDLLHEQIQALKAERDNLSVGLQEERRKYHALEEQLLSLPGRTIQSVEEVQQQIARLDWEIQTNPLTPDQEAPLIKQIRELEKEYVIHRDRSRVHTKLRAIQQAIATFNRQLFEVNEQIRAFAAESQEHHIHMLAKTEVFQTVKAEADHAHQRFLNCLKEVKDLRSTYTNCQQQLRELTSQIGRLEEEKRLRVVDAEAEAQRKTATEKLKGKKKMSFEEFKSLLDKGLV